MMRMTKLALTSSLMLALTIGATTSAFAWDDSKADDATWQKQEAARMAAVTAAYNKCTQAYEAWAAAKVKAESAGW